MVAEPGATHVNVIGGVGPEAVMDAAPVHEPEHTTFVIVGTIVMDVGCVMRNVWDRVQFRLSLIFTV
jgi:hypothetical protein